jgi:flagellar biosynthesis/type III secretory pathway chaperone
MQSSQERLLALESLLVKEFRASQALFDLTREERLALSRDDAQRLLDLAGHKQVLIDRLAALEAARQTAWLQLAAKLEARGAAPEPGQDPIEVIAGDDARRLSVLLEGIHSLMADVRQLTRGNRVLAFNALQRSNDMQARLVGLYQASTQDELSQPLYPPGKAYEKDHGEADPHSSQPGSPGDEATGGQTSLPAVFAAIVATRDAIQANDHLAISAAIGDLQQALDQLGRLLGRPRQSPRGFQDLASPSIGQPSNTREKASFVEALAGLYRQEAAYQAVLNVSSRILVGV